MPTPLRPYGPKSKQLRRPVIIGHVSDLPGEDQPDLEEVDEELSRLAQATARARRVRARLLSLQESRGDIWDAQSGELVDQSGLVVHHEIDPKFTATIAKFGEGLQRKGMWFTLAGGIVVGLILAGIAYWMSTTRSKR